MKNKTGAEHIRAYLALLNRIRATGVCDPKMHILDNEASLEYQTEIKKHAKMQMVPPDTHRRNIAERAIQTFKSHFIAILAGVDPRFPIFLWANCYHKQYSPWISCDHQTLLQKSQPMHMSMDNSITLPCLWPPWSAPSNFMSSHIEGKRGARIQSMDGTWALQRSITGAIAFGTLKQS